VLIRERLSADGETWKGIGHTEMGFGGFSWKRALGISTAKARLSRRIGVPVTRSGRQRKLGALVNRLLFRWLCK